MIKFNPLTGDFDLVSAPYDPAADTIHVLKSGDTMTGLLQLNTPLLDKSLDLTSTDAGGLNSFNSTGRINLHSYQKAQRNNDTSTNVGQAHYGEVLRIDLEHQQAKGAIAIRENYLGAGYPRTVAWMVAHGLANDGLSWHNHFSIELPDENGDLQTSLEFPFAPHDTANAFGMPTADRYVRSVVPLLAAGDMYIENTNSTNKNLYFMSSRYKDNTGKRFGLQVDNTTETGSNVGSDFRFNRYDDTGTFISTPLYIKRSNGQIGINQTSPSAQLDVVGTTELNGAVSVPTSQVSIGNATAQGGAKLYIEASVSQVGMLFRNTTAAGNNAANIVSQSQTSGSRAFQAGLQSDSVNRISVEHSGLIEWGAGGASGRDTNLYRSAANVLKTDDKMDAASFAVGGVNGASGTFTTADSKTVTVTNGLITSIV